MQSVGTRLREARIKKGYTLEEINARTRISLKNLNAIESDDLTKISSPFTYRSFVKQISDIVGIDHATLANDAQTASSTMPEPLVPGQEEEVYARPHQFQPVKPKSNLNWVKMASVAGVIGVVSLYFLFRSGGVSANKITASPLPASSQLAAPAQDPSPAAIQATLPAAPTLDQKTSASVQPVPPKNQDVPQSQAAPPPPPGTEQLLPPSQVAAHAEPTPTTIDPPLAAATEADPASAAIHIELSAIQPTWLSISADGKTTYRGTLAAMKTMSFNGKEIAQIRTANAGGVNIIFNGRALGSLGRHGQSRTFVFTKSGYEVVQGVGGSISRVLPTGGL